MNSFLLVKLSLKADKSMSKNRGQGFLGYEEKSILFLQKTISDRAHCREIATRDCPMGEKIWKLLKVCATPRLISIVNQ
jgi:hypothetical protein